MRLPAKFVILILTLTMVSISACSYIPKLPKPKMPSLSMLRLDRFPGVYKIDIQQGNVITQDMIDQLKPGMTKRQVQFVMGSPLIKDSFRQNRWDYVYSFQPGGKERQQESVTLYFENDLLSHFEGDFMPSETIL